MSKRRWVGMAVVGLSQILGACGAQTLTANGTSGVVCVVAPQDANTLVLEAQVLALMNAARGQGATCGAKGAFKQAPPLADAALLDCVARAQSKAMATQAFFSHTDPDGSTPEDRMTASGYKWSAMGENIAAGLPTAEAVMTQWMQSDGHCANIMSPDYSQAGVGFYQTRHGDSPYEYYWTQEFAYPAGP